jgi:hypothetical protein
VTTAVDCFGALREKLASFLLVSEGCVAESGASYIPPVRTPQVKPKKGKKVPTDYSKMIALGHQMVDALLDSLGPAAVLTTAMMTVLYALTYKLIWEDHMKISARWPLGHAEANYSAPKPSPLVAKVKAALASKCAGRGAAADKDGGVAEAEEAKKPDTSADAPEQQPEKAVGGRFADGTLDIVHNFQARASGTAMRRCATPRCRLTRARAHPVQTTERSTPPALCIRSCSSSAASFRSCSA